MSLPSSLSGKSQRHVAHDDALLPDLYQVIADNAPDAIKTGEIKNHFGRKVAIVCSFNSARSSGCVENLSVADG